MMRSMGSGLAINQIPNYIHRASAPPLARFATVPERNPAIEQAFATGCYSMKEIAQEFDIHYATVSRIVKIGATKV